MDDICDDNFMKLKQKLTSVLVLAYPDYKKSFILDTDASFNCIGTVLSQIDEKGQEQVVSYLSLIHI